jgi:hypothetical protein
LLACLLTYRFVQHECDFLSRAAVAANARFQALLGRSLHFGHRPARWIEAKVVLTCDDPVQIPLRLD